MNSPFIAEPPMPLGKGKRKKVRWEVWRLARGFGRIMFQVFVPFNARPEAPQDPPEPLIELDDKQIDQCQQIFDRVEATRNHLEEKARATFALVALMAPLLASIFVFVLSKTAPDTPSRAAALVLSSGSAGMLVLGFISAVRAVTIQTREELFIGAVMDLGRGEFRKYDKAFHARGLLYCASVNQAMNDHIAQFVKGAQLLTAVAVLFLIVASVPTGIAFSKLPSTPTQTEIVGPVTVTSTELVIIRDDVANLRKDVAKIADRKAVEEDLRRLEEKVAQLETLLQSERRGPSVRANKNGRGSSPGPP